MSRERFARLKELLLAVADLPDTERAAGRTMDREQVIEHTLEARCS